MRRLNIDTDFKCLLIIPFKSSNFNQIIRKETYSMLRVYAESNPGNRNGNGNNRNGGGAIRRAANAVGNVVNRIRGRLPGANRQR